MDDEWTEVGEWSSVDEADEHALVALAMRTDCRVMPKDDAFTLEVAPERAEPVRGEIELYAGEQERRPVPEEIIRPAGWGLALSWALALGVVHVFRETHPEIVRRGANDAVKVWQDGEWWRAFTALFLHGDGGHLLGNLLIGGAFCVMVGTVLGAWRGWALILLSGFLGNLATGWLHLHFDGPFRSIGASTATFGALGLIVGAGLARAWRQRRYGALKPLAVPLAVGATLLGMFGAGGVETDVVGHLCGWMCGIFLGLGAALAGAGRGVVRQVTGPLAAPQ
ncbi:rhomboid family intramembrane serine protease [Haloferula sargassicola]|uniref:Peptidase S54 rhomboid domain-containing protein n=1 Tax=Haloferula sargassicola TaxID=490096 RepID=A0ABP9UP19_9BACT